MLLLLSSILLESTAGGLRLFYSVIINTHCDMSTTVQNKLVGGFAALALLFAFAPLAFAEETGTTDWETKAQQKIELVDGLVANAEALIEDLEEDSDERVEAEEDLAEADEVLTEATTAFEAEDYEEAYEKAADAYTEVSDLIDHLKEDEEDDTDENEDEDNDKKHPTACKKDVRGYAYGMRAKCDDDGRPVAERVRELKDKRKARCEEAALDGEVDRKDYFCRAGKWKEKREARLDDLLAGAVEAADLTDEQAEVIREEMIDLIRQLITRLFQARTGS